MINNGLVKPKTTAGKLMKPVQKVTRSIGNMLQKATLDNENVPPPSQKIEHKEALYLEVAYPNVQGSNREIFCVDFIDDIFDYLRYIEKKFVIEEGFLSEKTTTGKMRSILVDWIIQVHQRLNLLSETLSLAIFILDAYLSLENVPKTSLQLTAMTSLFIAAKVEETYTPDIKEYEYIGDGQFKKHDMLRLELQILSALNCCLYRPAHITFLRHYTSQFDLPDTIHKRAQYFIEVCIQDYQLCHLRPSQIVVLAISLAAELDGHPIDMKLLLEKSEIDDAQMANWRAHLAYAISINIGHPKLKGIFLKYSNPRFLKVSELTSPQRHWLDKQFEKAE